MNEVFRPLEGRVALVTGSGRNIGAAIARHLSRAGAAVAVNGRHKIQALQEMADGLRREGGQACVAIGDVGKSIEVDRMVRHVEETLGPIDIVVSNAAMRPMHAFLDITDEDWNSVIATNLSASFFIARRTLPGMLRNKWGRFIHISGLDGFTGHVPLRAHNVACKAGVVALAKAIAREFGGQGITANTVAPGAIDTERDWSQYPHFSTEEVLKDIPVSRLGTVDDVAQACVYLSSDAASFVSGQTIHVNGGQYMF